VTQLWSGAYTQSGASVTVKNAAYNGVLAAGAKTSFGFIGSVSGTNNPPSSITVTTT
jgi:alpha-L-fucosidase 2